MLPTRPWPLILLLLTLALLPACRRAPATPIPATAPFPAPPHASPSPLPPAPTLAATPTPLPPAPTTPSTLPPPTPTAGPPPTLAPAQPGTRQGFDLVGHTALGSIGWHAGLALHDHCAYVGNRRSAAIAIVDIGDPATLAPIGTIPLGPEAQPVELRTLSARDLLVVADFGHNRLLTYDVSACASPVQVGALTLPGAPHEFYLWTDGERVLVYGAMFDQADPDLIVVDVTDPAAPVELARWDAGAAGIDGLLHSLSVSPAGDRAYLALWNGGVLVAALDLPQVRVLRDAAGTAHPAPFAAAHSAVPLSAEGATQYLLVTSELWGCPFASLAIVAIADPVHPNVVAQVGLPENRCVNLPAADAVFTPHNPLVLGDLAFVSWYGAGVQVLDLSDPQAPRRIAQFVPAGEGAAPLSYLGTYPVQTWSYPILHDGLLYVVDIQSGLYALRYTGPGAAAVAAVAHAEGNVTQR